MINSQYKYRLVNKDKKPIGKEVFLTRKYTFRDASNNQYILDCDEISFENSRHNIVYVVKFFDKKHRLSSSKFNVLTNSNHAITVLSTCVHIMLSIYKNEDKNASFCFQGAKLDIEKNEVDTKRFRLYGLACNRVFSPLVFEHLKNKERSTYILLNKNINEKERVIVVSGIENLQIELGL